MQFSDLFHFDSDLGENTNFVIKNVSLKKNSVFLFMSV